MNLRRFLIIASNLLPEPRVIYDREGGSPYLSRWYLTSRQGDVDPELFDQRLSGSRTWTPKLFLHRFHRSDDDGALHSHPWSWAVSLVLVGGYREERRVGNAVSHRRVLPGSLNFLGAKSYHRVDLIEDDCWSLFLVGPKIDTWYFWDRHTGKRCQWREYIRALRNGTPEAAPWEEA